MVAPPELVRTSTLVVRGGQSAVAALTRFMRLLLTLMLQADVSQDAPEVVWI